MAHGSEVVIKNTFLEVGKQVPLLQRSDEWRRQMSEPVKLHAGHAGLMRMLGEDLLSDSDDEDPRLRGPLEAGILLPGRLACPPKASSASATPHGQGDSKGVVFLSKEALEAHRISQEKGLAMLQGAQAQPRGSSPQNPSQQAGFQRQRTPPAPQSQEPPSAAQQHHSEGSHSRPKGAAQQNESKRAKQQDGAARRNEQRTKEAAINRIKDLDITTLEPPWTDVTTVMMRNLPNKYTREMLLEEISDRGFMLETDFDFFYLPMDHSNAANLGYAFINFVKPQLANAFAEAFSGKKMRKFNSNKTVVAMPASVQGYQRNHEYYSSTRVLMTKEPQYRPIFTRTADFKASAVPGARPAKKEKEAKPERRVGEGGQMLGLGGRCAAHTEMSGGDKHGGPGDAAGGPGQPIGGPATSSAGDDSGCGSGGYGGCGGRCSPERSGGCGEGWAGGQSRGGGKGWSDNQEPSRRCCGQEWSGAHRFCAFCGSPLAPARQQPPPEPLRQSGPGTGAGPGQGGYFDDRMMRPGCGGPCGYGCEGGQSMPSMPRGNGCGFDGPGPGGCYDNGPCGGCPYPSSGSSGMPQYHRGPCGPGGMGGGPPRWSGPPMQQMQQRSPYGSVQCGGGMSPQFMPPHAQPQIVVDMHDPTMSHVQWYPEPDSYLGSRGMPWSGPQGPSHGGGGGQSYKDELEELKNRIAFLETMQDRGFPGRGNGGPGCGPGGGPGGGGCGGGGSGRHAPGSLPF